MKQLMDRGAFGSFTGIITFKNAELIRDAAKLQGLGRLMIETDAPLFGPHAASRQAERTRLSASHC